MRSLKLVVYRNASVLLFSTLVLMAHPSCAESYNLLTWNITITGVAGESQSSLSRDFQGNGVIYALIPGIAGQSTNNGVNSHELILSVGDPTCFDTGCFYPSTGSIEFSTHSIWYQLKRWGSGIEDIDLAYVDFRDGCSIVEPDWTLFGTGNLINTYAFLGATFKIESGSITICSQDGFQTIFGEINLTGKHTIGNQPGYYQARIYGNLVFAGPI